MKRKEPGTSGVSFTFWGFSSMNPDIWQMWSPGLRCELQGLWHRTPVWKRKLWDMNHFPLLICIILKSTSSGVTVTVVQCTYFCWLSPALMRILWTSMSELSESPDHQEETIFNMLEADQLLVSSHLNFNISRSPISFSVTSRKEWVLLVAIFSFLTDKHVEWEEKKSVSCQSI